MPVRRDERGRVLLPVEPERERQRDRGRRVVAREGEHIGRLRERLSSRAGRSSRTQSDRCGSVKFSVVGPCTTTCCVTEPRQPSARCRRLVGGLEHAGEGVEAARVGGRRERVRLLPVVEADRRPCDRLAARVAHAPGDRERRRGRELEERAVLDAVRPGEDELAARAVPLLQRLPRVGVTVGRRVVREALVTGRLGRDRDRPRRDELARGSTSRACCSRPAGSRASCSPGCRAPGCPRA